MQRANLTLALRLLLTDVIASVRTGNSSAQINRDVGSAASDNNRRTEGIFRIIPSGDVITAEGQTDRPTIVILNIFRCRRRAY